jgi:hypothetical protein
MRQADTDLTVLCDYLSLPRPTLYYSKFANDNHLKNPRFLAMVIEGRSEIHASTAIESVPADVRIGLLLHELAHARGIMDEVEADAWVIGIVPEAGYHYVDEVSFKSPLYEDPVIARNVQCVSQQFMKTIGHMEED